METLIACYECNTQGLLCNKQRPGCPIKDDYIGYATIVEQRIFEGPGARERAMAWAKEWQDKNRADEYTAFLHDLADLGITP